MVNSVRWNIAVNSIALGHLLLLLIGSVHAQEQDERELRQLVKAQLISKVLEEFGARYKVAAVVEYCGREELASRLKPDGRELLDFLGKEGQIVRGDEGAYFRDLPADEAFKVVAAVTDILSVGYYLGYLESTRFYLDKIAPAISKYSDFVESRCEQSMKQGENMLKEMKR